VKKLRKSVNICQSYHKNKHVSFFMVHSVELLQCCSTGQTRRWQTDDRLYTLVHGVLPTIHNTPIYS